MKKVAMVVGGSNGIGAATVKKLLSENYSKVYIVDKTEPILQDKKITFIRFNLLSDNPKRLLEYQDIDTLIITAGMGRLDYFQNFSRSEIDIMFQVNTISPIKIIKTFYHKINSPENFYCAIISSIAGIVSSPLYAIYSATKAAVSMFVESVNAELQGQNLKNRILAVAPGEIKGTAFRGNGETDFDLIDPLANDIYDEMIKRNTLFVPNFEVYGKVINRYREDPQKFGLESFNYKLQREGLQPKSKLKVGYLSGSFDLFHIGHLNLLRRAKRYCDYLIVGVHPDGSHKGKNLFIPLEQRIKLIRGTKYADKVIECLESDLDAYNEIKYDFLFVGSDYKGTDRFNHYEEVLKPLGVEIIYFPYTKETNSTQIRDKITKN